MTVCNSEDNDGRMSPQSLMVQYVVDNVSICRSAKEAIECGDIHGLASAMTAAQTSFDKCAMPNCLSELTSPILHSVINDTHIRDLALAVKGVGSQGDGSVQFLCVDESRQHQVLEYMKITYGMSGFKLTVPVSVNA